MIGKYYNVMKNSNLNSKKSFGFCQNLGYAESALCSIRIVVANSTGFPKRCKKLKLSLVQYHGFFESSFWISPSLNPRFLSSSGAIKLLLLSAICIYADNSTHWFIRH